MNPSNFGIAATLFVFPSVAIAPPYQFTENLETVGDWALLAILFLGGSFLNFKLTGRLPLVFGWLIGFFLQAVARAILLDANLAAALLPATGVAFLLFTFYMVTDPATTPRKPSAQIIFGSSIAAAYGLLTSLHIPFGLFFALCLVCAVRLAIQLWHGFVTDSQRFSLAGADR